jgi:hypothetical protein
MTEAVAVVACIAILAPAALYLGLRSRQQSRLEREQSQLRAIHQSLVLAGQGGPDEYPTPSRMDRLNVTVAGEGKAKDTTANVFSFLIFTGVISPEVFVSPVEVNPNVKVCKPYEFDRPKGAVDPLWALWDPKFSGTLDGSKPGHFSYAAIQILGPRRAKWSNTFSSTEAVLSLRGPEVSSVTQHADGTVTPTLANPKSNTLRFYGKGLEWSGPMAFNDNHVEFRTGALAHLRPVPASSFVPYKDAAGVARPDIWCYDEPDDPLGGNDYLGIFLKAGEKAADWSAAWD